MKKLWISLLLGATILATGCTQAKEIGKVNNIENKVEEKIEEGETKEDIEQTRKDGIKFIDSFLKENLKILTRFILFRDYGDLSRLKQKDIDFINNNYNIKIDYSEILQREDYSTIEIIDLFEEERNIQKKYEN